MENRIHPNVEIGAGAAIGFSVIVGEPPRGAKPGGLKTRIGRNATIRSHSVIYAGCTAGDNLETGHGVMIRENNRIGDDVSIGTHTIIERDCTIADGARLHSCVFIPEFTVIEKGAWIGPGTVLTNAPYPKGKDSKQHLKGPVIEENAKIGANCTILPGVRLGRNCLIGAGSVVTKDVEENSVAVGNPARAIKKVSDLRYGDGEKPY